MILLHIMEDLGCLRTERLIIGNISGKTKQVVQGKGRILKDVIFNRDDNSITYEVMTYDELDLDDKGIRQLLRDAFNVFVIDETPQSQK